MVQRTGEGYGLPTKKWTQKIPKSLISMYILGALWFELLPSKVLQNLSKSNQTSPKKRGSLVNWPSFFRKKICISFPEGPHNYWNKPVQRTAIHSTKHQVSWMKFFPSWHAPGKNCIWIYLDLLNFCLFGRCVLSGYFLAQVHTKGRFRCKTPSDCFRLQPGRCLAYSKIVMIHSFRSRSGHFFQVTKLILLLTTRPKQVQEIAEPEIRISFTSHYTP